MKEIKIWSDTPSQDQAREIADRLADGEVMVYPTDTLYALGCDALNPRAVDKLCRIKDINPAKTDLSIMCADIAQASEYARIDNAAFRLMRDNTPGPFTFLLRASSSLPKAFKGRKSVGVRIPASQTVRDVVSALGHPLLTASIDFDDDDYALSPSLMAEQYDGLADFIVVGEEGGTTPSTVVDCREDEPMIVRQGLGKLK